jgi:hypothetical protein
MGLREPLLEGETKEPGSESHDRNSDRQDNG